MGESEFVSVPVPVMQSLLNYVQFGSFPNGCTVQEVIWLNEQLLKAIRDSGIAIVARPAEAKPEDFIEDPS